MCFLEDEYHLPFFDEHVYVRKFCLGYGESTVEERAEYTFHEALEKMEKFTQKGLEGENCLG